MLFHCSFWECQNCEKWQLVSICKYLFLLTEKYIYFMTFLMLLLPLACVCFRLNQHELLVCDVNTSKLFCCFLSDLSHCFLPGTITFHEISDFAQAALHATVTLCSVFCLLWTTLQAHLGLFWYSKYDWSSCVQRDSNRTLSNLSVNQLQMPLTLVSFPMLSTRTNKCQQFYSAQLKAVNIFKYLC